MADEYVVLDRAERIATITLNRPPYNPLSIAMVEALHGALDAIKSVMTGAHAVQMVSALLKHGPEYLREVRTGMAEWLEKHEYDSLRQMRGSMSLERCPDPAGYERANYMEILQMWEG